MPVGSGGHRVGENRGEFARHFARGGEPTADTRAAIAARERGATHVLSATLHVTVLDTATAIDVTEECYAVDSRFTPREMAATLAGRAAGCTDSVLFLHTMTGEARVEADAFVPDPMRV